MGHPGNERLSLSQTVFVDTQKTKYLYSYVFVARFNSGRHYRFNWKTLKFEDWRQNDVFGRYEIV
jgi:hypothetical protein